MYSALSYALHYRENWDRVVKITTLNIGARRDKTESLKLLYMRYTATANIFIYCSLVLIDMALIIRLYNSRCITTWTLGLCCIVLCVCVCVCVLCVCCVVCMYGMLNTSNAPILGKSYSLLPYIVKKRLFLQIIEIYWLIFKHRGYSKLSHRKMSQATIMRNKRVGEPSELRMRTNERVCVWVSECEWVGGWVSGWVNVNTADIETI